MRALLDQPGRNPAPASLPGFAWALVLGVAVAMAVVLTVVSGRYGFHRDELYFLAAGAHPALGYVDQPPLTPLLARLSTAVFGATPAGLRVVETVTGAGTVMLTGLMAREMGARRGGQVLAAAAVAGSAYVLVASHMVATASVDLLVAAGLGWLVLRLLRTGQARWWCAIGAVVAVGLFTKDLVLLYGGAFGASVLAAGPRETLRSRWLVLGAVIAVAGLVPNVVWQAGHGWPEYTVATGISATDGRRNRLLFIPEQLVYLSPVLVPVWVAGLGQLMRDPALRWARPTALAYLIGALVVLGVGGKPYYVLPLLLAPLAAGAQPVLDWVARNRTRRAVGAATGMVGLAVSAVIALPLLPVGLLAHTPIPAINPELGEQIGWPALTDAVAVGWARIPPAQRPTAVIFTGNYGEAGALVHDAGRLGLPAPFSGHMSFATWGPPPEGATGPVVLVHRATDTHLQTYFQTYFRDCHTIATIDTGITNQEQGAVVALCSGTTASWPRLWPALRHYY